MKTHLAGEIARAIKESFGVEHAPVLEVPPRRELGDLASPAGMQLARTLKRNPRAIAEEIAGRLSRPGFVLRHGRAMLAHTFRGSSWRSWLGLEDERTVFARYKTIRREERESVV